MGIEALKVPGGTASGLAYVVNYEEDLWLALPDAHKAHCHEVWEQRAQPLGLEVVALRLFPDELFPAGEHDRPYIAWQKNLRRDPPAVKPLVSVDPVKREKVARAIWQGWTHGAEAWETAAPSIHARALAAAEAVLALGQL